jgi:hypothetical protein
MSTAVQWADLAGPSHDATLALEDKTADSIRYANSMECYGKIFTGINFKHFNAVPFLHPCN